MSLASVRTAASRSPSPRLVARRQARQAIKGMSDADIVKQVKGGNKQAFGELIKRYQQKVYSLALKITKNEADAREVKQEAFMNAFAKLSTFRGDSAFSSWLYRVTANAALMLVRMRRRESADSIDDLMPRFDADQRHLFPMPEWTTHADRVFERKEIHTVVNDGFSSLPEGYRVILFLREVEFLSNQEIAEVLSISVAAVKSRLHRARLVLRDHLSPYYYAD